MVIEAKCPECNTTRNITVNTEDFIAYKKGLSIIKAFPYLSADDREGIITGYCSQCWDKLFDFENCI